MIMFNVLIGNACVDGENGYTCVCNEGFAGLRCELELDPCDPEGSGNPCHNNAICCRRGLPFCAPSMAVGQFECYCKQGYTGACDKNDILKSRVNTPLWG